MTYSTGRGGAGNIHQSKSKTSELDTTTNNTRDHTQQELNKTISGGEQKQVYYSTGRGGAGNIKRSDQLPSPKLVPVGSNTPHLTTSKVTTGRGGFGNMVDNNDPELTRKLQDVDGEKLSKVGSQDLQATNSKGFSVGRGGFGNVVLNTKSRSSSDNEQQGGGMPALYSVSSHGPKKDKKKGGFLEKIKEIFA